MKTRSMLVCVLALAALPQPSAAQQSDPRLTPSLTPFVRERHPMRDPRRIKPYGEVTGSVPGGHYLGGSWTVNIWFKNMNTQLQPLGERLRALDSDLQLYDVSVNVTGKELLQKADATTRAKLEALARGKKDVMEKLQAYRLVKAKQTVAAKEEGAALEDVWGAIAAVDADDAVVRKAEMVDEKVSLEARQLAIREKVKKAAWVKDAYETVKSVVSTLKDPDKIKDYLATKAAEAIDEALMNNVLLQYAQELNDIENRLTQLEPAIKKAGDQVIRKRLEDSQARLRAARIRLVKTGIQRTIASVEGWDIVDALASAESSNKGTTDVFQKLQQYNLEVRTVGKQMRAHGADYLAMLNGGPPGEAPQVLKKIEADVAYVWPYNQKTTNDPLGIGGEFYPWLQQADVTRVYTQFQSEWYKVERDKVERYMTAIVSESHLDLVDKTVRQLLKTMGSTTDI